MALIAVTAEAFAVTTMRLAMDGNEETSVGTIVGMALTAGLAIGIHDRPTANRLLAAIPAQNATHAEAAASFVKLMRQRVETNRRMAQAREN